MYVVTQFHTPQMKTIHSGKVRESLYVDEKTRIIVASDRVSCFDRIMNTAIPYKGAVLNGLAAAWLSKTRHIIENHLIEVIDPNISLVKEAKPIAIEMIVRKFMTGSIWRQYSKGKRLFSGVVLPDGLKRNDPFPEIIITPTTKGLTDLEISPEEILAQGIVSKDIYEEMEAAAKQLFSYAHDLCASKGIILVDSKYEFGFLDDKLILIDELHTPDSSRFWCAEHYERDPSKEHSLDKEFIRQWILKQENCRDLNELPDEIVLEASQRYLKVYEALLGEELKRDEKDPYKRMYENLFRSSLIKDAYVAIVMGSKKDLPHARKLQNILRDYDVMVDMRILSAHKNGEDMISLAREYNHSIEVGSVIAVAGRSNGLGGALSANLAVPVINCPPFKDKVDMLVNINSSLMMPSDTPAATCVDVNSAVKMALRSLNLPRLKKIFIEEIRDIKANLRKEDEAVREKAKEYVLS